MRTELKQATEKYDDLNYRLLNDSTMFKDLDVKKENEFLKSRLAEIGPLIIRAE